MAYDIGRDFSVFTKDQTCVRVEMPSNIFSNRQISKFKVRDPLTGKLVRPESLKNRGLTKKRSLDPSSKYQWRHLSTHARIHFWNWPIAILCWDCCSGTWSEKCCLVICSVNEDFSKSWNWNWKINHSRGVLFDEYLWCAIWGIWSWKLYWKYFKNQGWGSSHSSRMILHQILRGKGSEAPTKIAEETMIAIVHNQMEKDTIFVVLNWGEA